MRGGRRRGDGVDGLTHGLRWDAKPELHPTPSPPPLKTGGMSKNYTHIKKLMFSEPAVLHGLLQRLADAVVTYIGYQVGRSD